METTQETRYFSITDFNGVVHVYAIEAVYLFKRVQITHAHSGKTVPMDGPPLGFYRSLAACLEHISICNAPGTPQEISAADVDSVPTKD